MHKERGLKDMKAGYQGKHDAMRSLAEKLMKHGGHAKDTNLSKDNMNKPYMRPYKEGGRVEGESRQRMDNMMFERNKKAAEMHEHRDHEDYEKRKRFDEAREHKDHEKFEHMKQGDPIMRNKMEEPAFKKGGGVKKSHESKMHKEKHHEMKKTKIPKEHEGKKHHYAAGGVAKIRHEEATCKGMPKNPAKGNMSSVYY